MVNYYILSSVINNLSKKYKSELPEDNERLYTYSNYINMFDYYKVFHVIKNKYNLKDKLLNTQNQLTLDFFVNKIRESNYNQDLIMLFYGYLVSQAIKEKIDPYLYSLCGSNKNKQDKLIKIITLINYDKVIDKTITLNETELEFLDSLFKQPFHFSYGIDIIKKANKEFNEYNQKSKVKLLLYPYYLLIDTLTKTNINLKISLRNRIKNNYVDYLNTTNNPWLNPYTNEYDLSSFDQLVHNTIDLASIYIDAANQAIYYNNRKPLHYLDFSPKEILTTENKNPIFSKLNYFKKQND